MSVGSQEPAIALYVVVEVDATAPQRVAAAVASRAVQSVLIRAAPGAKLDATTARPLVEAVQRAGIAAVLGGDARLARTLKADGVHIPWSDDSAEVYAEAREILGARAIVGAEAGPLRHDAMVMAEAGVDYVGFSAAEGEDARVLQAELVAWWGEIFQIPCVAFDVAGVEDAAALADAGADFIGLAPVRGETVADFARRIADCAAVVGSLGGRS